MVKSAVCLMVMAMLCFVGCGRKSAQGPRGAATTQAGTLSEDQKIENLIAVVGGLKGAKFIRNGSEHDSSAAAGLMRYKWKQNESSIRTAEDFIRVAASRSKLSGSEYRVKLADGREMSSAEFLMGKLREMQGR